MKDSPWPTLCQVYNARIFPAICIAPFVFFDHLLPANSALAFITLVPISYLLTSYFVYAERLVFSRPEPPKWSSIVWLDRTGWKTFGAMLLFSFFRVLNFGFVEHLVREGQNAGVFIAYLLVALPFFALSLRLAFILPAIATGNDATFREVWKLGRKKNFSIMGSVICVALVFYLMLFSIGALLWLIGNIIDIPARWQVLLVPVSLLFGLMFEILKIALMAVTIAVLYKRAGGDPAAADPADEST